MNTAHRLADGIRSVIGYWTPTPSTSQFIDRGMLTPQEFIEAGDQLVYKFPTWEWQPAESRRQVSWLPPKKQYLITRGVACRHRVRDLDASLAEGCHINNEGWFLPCNDDYNVDDIGDKDSHNEDCQVISYRKPVSLPTPIQGNSSAAAPAVACTVLAPHQPDIFNFSDVNALLQEEDDEDGSRSSKSSFPRFNNSKDCTGISSITDTYYGQFDHREGEEERRKSDILEGLKTPRRMKTSMRGGATKGGEGAIERQHEPLSSSMLRDESPTRREGNSVIQTRSYDLSVTYDKYYRTPRLWLFGYNETGVPLEAESIFEDILTEYVTKTVTIDPHPATGILTVSIHPCRHAALMKRVVEGWLAQGIKPRPDLALFVILKFISSVIPTIAYDFTVDIQGFRFSGSSSSYVENNKPDDVRDPNTNDSRSASSQSTREKISKMKSLDYKIDSDNAKKATVGIEDKREYSDRRSSAAKCKITSERKNEDNHEDGDEAKTTDVGFFVDAAGLQGIEMNEGSDLF